MNLSCKEASRLMSRAEDRELSQTERAALTAHLQEEQGSANDDGSGCASLLEMARTLFLLGRFDGVEAYFEGAASDDSTTVAGYRNDLATIASDSVMAEFDRTSGPVRAAYLRNFWSERDKIELRPDGERLREHYRRLFYARRNFQLTSLSRHYEIVERYRSGSRDFDDRARIRLEQSGVQHIAGAPQHHRVVRQQRLALELQVVLPGQETSLERDRPGVGPMQLLHCSAGAFER